MRRRKEDVEASLGQLYRTRKWAKGKLAVTAHPALEGGCVGALAPPPGGSDAMASPPAEALYQQKMFMRGNAAVRPPQA